MDPDEGPRPKCAGHQRFLILAMNELNIFLLQTGQSCLGPIFAHIIVTHYNGNEHGTPVL